MPGHVHVEEHQVGSDLLRERERRDAVPRGDDAHALVFERDAHELHHAVFVVGDEHVEHAEQKATGCHASTRSERSARFRARSRAICPALMQHGALLHRAHRWAVQRGLARDRLREECAGGARRPPEGAQSPSGSAGDGQSRLRARERRLAARVVDLFLRAAGEPSLRPLPRALGARAIDLLRTLGGVGEDDHLVVADLGEAAGTAS